MIRVLLVDDDPLFARAMRRALAMATSPIAMTVDDCRSARAALARLAERPYDAALVDGVLGDMSGIELGRRIRELGHSIALILVTGRLLEPVHELEAFATGFDDFLRKPVDPSMLRARIAAVVRRTAIVARPSRAASRQQLAWNALGDAALEVKLDEPLATVRARPVELTPLEWRLLRVLYAERGSTVSRAGVMREAWGGAPPAHADKALDKQVHALRIKLGDPGGKLLETIRGCGFRLNFARNAKIVE